MVIAPLMTAQVQSFLDSVLGFHRQFMEETSATGARCPPIWKLGDFWLEDTGCGGARRCQGLAGMACGAELHLEKNPPASEA